jgi:protein-tyrosine-phosphatase/DNA-binding HxlR family transcriptional regulator
MNTESNSVAARARVHAALGDPGRLAIVDTLLVGDASPGELAAEMGMPSNLIAHHLKVLHGAGLLTRTRSEGDRRRTYLRLLPEALASLTPARANTAPRVVFVCRHNSARSQLAAALWARRSPIPAASAGTQPAARVHPRAVRIARRHGLALGRARPTHLTQVVRDGDLLVAVCDLSHEQLDTPPDRRLHWSVPDPARADTDDAFESAYADLAGRVDRLAPVLAPGGTP